MIFKIRGTVCPDDMDKLSERLGQSVRMTRTNCPDDMDNNLKYQKLTGLCVFLLA